jgi:hypothetical protein
MDRLAYLLLILILVSCDNLKEIKKDEITFHFTDNIPKTKHAVIADYISEEIDELKLEEVGIKDIKVDSVPFSIVLYIPYSNQITKEVEKDFKSLTSLLSEFDFNRTPVHAVLTDEEFNPKINLPYDKGAVSYFGKTMVRGRAEVELSESAESFSADILEHVLRNRMPELYKGTDSVKISVDMVNDTIKIDFNIDRKENNLDTLRKEFLDTDRLFFDLLFERRTILFHVRDKGNKELLAVLGLKGA